MGRPEIDSGAPLDGGGPAVIDEEVGVIKAYRRARSDRTLRRESDVMGLTAAVVLIAALSTGNDLTPHSKLDVLIVVWGTTIGLALVHWFAQLVAARLVSDPSTRYSPRELLISQTAMAVVVAVAATAFVVVLPSKFDRLGARVAAALFIGVLAALETRVSGLPTSRRFVLSAGLSAAGVTVAMIKWYLS